jgi:hypothetical protein
MTDDTPSPEDDEPRQALAELIEQFTPTLPQQITPPDGPEGRDRGFLTSSDREFLRGDWSTDSEYEQQVRSNNKSRIRGRIVNALRDLPILLSLDVDQRAKVYETVGRADMRTGLGALVAFTYLASEKDRDLIEDAVADGIYTAEHDTSPADPEKGEVQDVGVSLDVEYAPNADDIYQRFQEKGPSSLSAGEIGILVQESKLSTDELTELNKPEDVRRAEDAAAEVQQLIEESDADTFEEWNESRETAEDGDDDAELSEGVVALVRFSSAHPDKEVRDFLDDEYLADN